jgi:hypothetical protein
MTFSEAVGRRGMDVATMSPDLSAVSKHLDMSFRAAPPAVSIFRLRVRCRHELTMIRQNAAADAPARVRDATPDNSWAPARLNGGRSPAL